MTEEKDHIEDDKAQARPARAGTDGDDPVGQRARHKESSESQSAKDKAVEKLESEEKSDKLETKQDTSNQQQATEHMEVHKHPHHITHKKHWGEYFLEFLMLFLAVFLGFVAENQREHMVEHKREKEYMVSMLNDIKADTTTLNHTHQIFASVTRHIDSLIPLLQSDDAMGQNAEAIYQHQVMLNYFAKWIYSDRTISQLKNSGNFRLIRKKSVSDKIIAYDGYIINFVGNMQEQYLLPMWRKLNDESNQIFKSSVFREYFKNGGFAYHPVRLPSAPYFLSDEKAKRMQFLNLLDQYAVAIEWSNLNINNALSRAVKLDSLIRHEYHLE